MFSGEEDADLTLFGTETGTAGDSVFADAGVKGAMNRNNFPRQLGVNEIKKLTEEIFQLRLSWDQFILVFVV